MKYKANRGGHAPGHLRDALLEYIEDASPSPDTMSIVGYYNEYEKPLRWLIGQLWNCSDIMPSDYCYLLGLEQGSTYAMSVRYIRERIQWIQSPTGHVWVLSD